MPSHLRRHDEPGHIHFWTVSCFRRLGFFHDEGMKRVVINGLRRLQERFGICLIGYVVMPDHVHVLLYPHARTSDEPVPVATLLHAFKKDVGFDGKARLRDIWRRDGKLWSPSLNQWARGEFGKQSIWTTRGYDFNIDRGDTLLTKLDYCHKNPVTRELVTGAVDWHWSSFRYYELDDGSVLAMDWDGEWPIVW